MFDENAHEALNRPQDNPVQHHGAVLFAVRADVAQVEALRQRKVALNRRALPFSLQGILELEVDFRSVESAVALIDVIGDVIVLERIFQSVRRQVPVRIRADRVFGTGAELHFIFETENAHRVIDKIGDGADFGIQLFRHAQNVRIVLRKLTHPHQTMENTGLFVAMNGAQFEIPQRQIPVAADFGFVNQHMRQAVHRLDAVSLLVHFREIHVFAVMIEMAGLLPQVHLENLGPHDHIVAAL